MRALLSGFVVALVVMALALFIADKALAVLERTHPAPTATCVAPKERAPLPLPEAGRAVIVDGRLQWAHAY